MPEPCYTCTEAKEVPQATFIPYTSLGSCSVHATYDGVVRFPWSFLSLAARSPIDSNSINKQSGYDNATILEY